MKIVKNTLIFTTGKAIHAFCGIIGISSEHDCITEGYDDMIHDPQEPDDKPLTPVERKELADYMVRRWTAWGEKWGKEEK